MANLLQRLLLFDRGQGRIIHAFTPKSLILLKTLKLVFYIGIDLMDLSIRCSIYLNLQIVYLGFLPLVSPWFRLSIGLHLSLLKTLKSVFCIGMDLMNLSFRLYVLKLTNCRSWFSSINVSMVPVKYRLTLEHPFSAAYEDFWVSLGLTLDGTTP